ncbi:MAG: ATP-binding protein [Desulfobacterales bacterium]|nr:ATP-binding protein [Desulfobacterales bacterium]
MEEGFRKQRVYYSITNKVFALNVLSDSYFLHPNERSKEQLHLVRQSLAKHLAQMEPGDSIEQAYYEDLADSHERVIVLFEKVVQEIGTNAGGGSREIRERLSSQLRNELSLMSSRASSLFFTGQKRLRTFQTRGGILLIALICCMLLVSGIVLLRTEGFISSSLARLRRGIQRAGEEKLDNPVEVQGPDEIAEVAKAFNQTTAKLKSAREALETEATERKKASDELKRSMERLEIKNRELQEFSFIASHDLNEPLRKIQTFGSLLEEKSADRLGEQEKDYISRMAGAANRMQELLNALLRYSRVDTKGQEFRAANLDDIVREAVSDLDVMIGEIGARVEIGPVCSVTGDPLQLRQLFQNLIANSLKYYRSEVTPFIRVHGEEDNGNCRILVEDNSLGFDEKYLDKIFQPFQRLHGRNEYPGTGIGLAICKKIVERHRGNITAKSIPGKGSTFIVSLPVGQTSPDAK